MAISNHRLLSFEDGKVAFRWKDYAHGNKKRQMTLDAREFDAEVPEPKRFTGSNGPDNARRSSSSTLIRRSKNTQNA